MELTNTPRPFIPNNSNFEGNRAAHIHTTGPEIHAQTKDLPGGLQAFICATGTGGTLAGVTRALKDLSGGKTQCWLADPPGSVLESFINRGVMERGGGSITEGEFSGGLTTGMAMLLVISSLLCIIEIGHFCFFG